VNIAQITCCVQVYNVAWPEHYTLVEFLREVELALGLGERQQFHSDNDADNIYLYPTVCPSSYFYQ